MIDIIIKDMTTVTVGIIVNGVNCQRKMGAGLALAIRRRWPKVYQQYMSSPSGPQMLGSVHFIEPDDCSEKLRIANCYTQLYYGNDHQRYASLSAITDALLLVFDHAALLDVDVYLGKIGCGLGGLDWNTEVSPIVKEIDSIYNINNNTHICEWK